jgi:hypothetical protein
MINKILQAFFAFLAAALAAPAMAQDESEGPLPFDALPADAASPFGGMAISPTRVVLDAGGRGASVTLYNSGGVPVTYRIDNVELGLDEAGNYLSLAEGEATPWAASPYLRFSPRQITLAPGQRQSVKIVARAPRDLPPGELRSHLTFSSIPLVKPAKAADDAGSADAGEDSVSVSVGLDYRITIPVLLRIGQPEGGSAILSATPSPGELRALRVTLARTGERSELGVVRAFDRSGQQIGILRGISVLPPGRTRIVDVPLSGDQPAAKVTFSADDAGRDAGAVLAEYAVP